MPSVFAPATRLMNQLRCSSKMYLISAIFLIPTLVTGYLLIDSNVRALNFVAEEENGLRIVAGLMALVEHVPEHRGMMAAVAGGDGGFVGKAAAKRQEIERDLLAVDEVLARYGAAMDLQSEWQAIRAEWQALAAVVQGLSAPESFARHTALIKRILYFATQTADASSLSLDELMVNHYLVEAVVSRIPWMMESLGQSRALATGIAARGQSTPDEKARLAGLVNAIQNRAEAVSYAMQAVAKSAPGKAAAFAQTREAAAKAIEQYTPYLQQHFLQPDAPTASAAEVFALASATIQQQKES